MQQKLLDMLLKNKSILTVLDCAEEIGLPDWYLVGGSIPQTVWNTLCGLPVDYGINDYDLIYFDPVHEKNPDKESSLQKAVGKIPIEIVNQAFVHMWLPKYLVHDMEPYGSIEQVMQLTSATAIAVGIKKEHGRYVVYAPYGLEDVFNMIIRPNKGLFTKKMYDIKAEKWKATWPKLEVQPWE